MLVLARQGKFDEILARLRSAPTAANNNGSSSRTNLDVFCNHTTTTSSRLGSLYLTDADQAAFPLHALLRFRPPVTVVDALIAALQHADCSSLAPAVLVPEEMRESTLQQTPLHVAVASRCSLQVIERLLQGESLVMPAMAKDGLHRFPLHWATAVPSPRRKKRDAEYRWDVIHFLLHQYPVAAVIPDVYNQTPLDYARHNKLHYSVVELLQEAATEYERYAPPRKSGCVGSPLREHTEATSLVSESELVPDELPNVIDPAAQTMAGPACRSSSKHNHNSNRNHKWWTGDDDDVSSLGGDYPPAQHFTLDEAGQTITKVTSLFSSALTFASANTAEESSVEHDGTPPSGNKVATAQSLPRPIPFQSTSPPLLLGNKEEASEHSSSSEYLYEPHRHRHHHQQQQQLAQQNVVCTASPGRNAPVRTKTLLKGQLQIIKPSSPKKSGIVERPSVPTVV